MQGPPCDGTIIGEITIEPRPPSLGQLTNRWRGALEVIDRLHTTTRPEVIRRFLLDDTGQPCTELRRAESERILRAQPFLTDATVYAIPDGSGQTRLHVITVDELSIVGALSASGDAPYLTRIKAGDGNLLGSGVYGAAEWRDGMFYRDAWYTRVTDYQVFGRPYQFTVEWGRRHLGEDWATEATHPFFTDVQRAAWRVSAGSSRGYFPFLREGAEVAALELHRSYADVGGIIRIGEPGRLSLFGASISRQREATADFPVLITDTGLVADTSTALMRRYGAHRTARINALWGVRNIRFARVAGFDALTATQDVRHGFQLGVVAGRSLSVLGSTDDDIFVAADLYGGLVMPGAFLGIQVLGEGRQNYDENHWDGIVGSGRAAAYVRVAPRHMLITAMEYSAGWRHRTPFQLPLGEGSGGVRGYADSRVTGGRRVVTRVEDRWLLGSLGRVADIGLAVFGDAGKVWASDVPFGVDTPIRYGAGIGLLTSIPTRARRMWRLDVAVPLSADEHAGWEIRLSSGDFTRSFWREPRDVARARERFVPASLFSWP